VNRTHMNALHMEPPSQYSTFALDAAQLPVEIERLATTIVAAQLRALFADAQGDCAPADAIAGLCLSYGRRLEATPRHLERHGLLAAGARPQRQGRRLRKR
jgi:hypothetical protein